jgi:hypothetical protein
MRTLLLLLCGLFCVPAWATQYYISPSGSDSNSGLSTSLSWQSPNHAVNCGDNIQAAAGTYSATAGYFSEGHWGAVSSCTFPTNEFATLQCATFDACIINATTDYAGIWIDKSHWAVMGWQVTMGGSTTQTSCFQASSNTSTGSNISFILFANNVAIGCYGAGFGIYSQNVSSVNYSADYIGIVGNIAYNGAQVSNVCGSGISVYQPIKADSVAGTHIYIAGNFSYGNLDPNPCDGAKPTDGEGIILDTFDGSQGGFALPYDQQAVVDNNLVFYNGGRGLEVTNNAAGSTHANIIFRNNTAANDMTDPNQQYCVGNGELLVTNSLQIQAYGNLTQANATGCAGANVVYGVAISGGNGTDNLYNSDFVGVSGNNTFVYSSSGFSYGPGNIVTAPAFASPGNPGAPSCSGKTNVPNCMATVIANYTPTATGALTYGRQTPSTTSIVDALYPQWLCNVSLPSGLVTPGCSVATSTGSGFSGYMTGGRRL